MSWLSHATGVHISPHGTRFNGGEFRSGLGNLVKNVSPLLAFTPLGALGAGVAGGVGGLIRGEGVGRAALSGLSNAGIGAGARTGVNALRGAFGGGAGASAAAPPMGGGAVPSAPVPGGGPGLFGNAGAGITPGSGAGGLPPLQGLGASSTPDLTQSLARSAANVAGNQPSGLAKVGASLGSGLSGVGSFIQHNPTAIGMGLQGAGHIATAGSQNRLANLQAQQMQADLEEQRRRQQSLDPLRQALMGMFTSQGPAVPRNPYGP